MGTLRALVPVLVISIGVSFISTNLKGARARGMGSRGIKIIGEHLIKNESWLSKMLYMFKHINQIG
jgi:hypothetical protein